MLLRRAAAAPPDGGEPGAGAGRPRLFAVPRLLVGLAWCGAAASPDCDSPAARSPTSPLDLRAFAALGGSLLRSPRSPRSWDSHRLGLGGLVDTLAADAAQSSLLGPQVRPQRLTRSYSSQPRACVHAPPGLGNVDTAAGGKPLPCSRSYGDVKSGPEAAVPGGAKLAASTHSSDLGKLQAPGSLPASIGGPRRYIGSVSATVLAQSEDYTCIIAHGPNPKTTRIFGDYILEPCPLGAPDGDGTEAMEEVKEGAESYWLVKCSGDAGDELLGSSCLSCNKKLDGSDACVYRGVKAFCSANCRDQEILTEEEEDKTTAMSSLSSVGSSSSFSDDIFMAGMVVLTGPFDAQIP